MDLKKADALFYLRWMFDAGADEAISEAPFNRFTEANSRKFENLRPVKKNEGEKVGLTVAEGESFKKKIGFNSKKLQEAYKVAKDCNTLDEIVESIEQFHHFIENEFRKEVNLCEGSYQSKVIVFREPEINNISNGPDFRPVDKNLLFESIFKSIGLSVEGQRENSLCVISTLPFILEDTSKDNECNFDLMWPFLLRCITVLKPVAAVFFGTNLSNKLSDISILMKENVDLCQLEIFNFPSLDVLIRAPKRKRVVWEQLLAIKELLLDSKKEK